jgi:hypothetical protein
VTPDTFGLLNVLYTPLHVQMFSLGLSPSRTAHDRALPIDQHKIHVQQRDLIEMFLALKQVPNVIVLVEVEQEVAEVEVLLGAEEETDAEKKNSNA